jgi:hypothetical protein
VLAAAGASRRLAALRPGPAGRPRGLAPLPPSQRPAPGLLRRREERQQQAEGPWATPEKQQLHSGERPEEAEAAMQRYPWHSDEWKEEYRKHLRVVSVSRAEPLPPPAAARCLGLVGAHGGGGGAQQRATWQAGPSLHRSRLGCDGRVGGGALLALPRTLAQLHFSHCSERRMLTEATALRPGPERLHVLTHLPPPPTCPCCSADLRL